MNPRRFVRSSWLALIIFFFVFAYFWVWIGRGAE